MYFDRDKKVLFVTGMDQKSNQVIQDTFNVRLENVLNIQIYGPEILQSYGDLMRDIIVTVYQENVEEIIVVGTNDDCKNTINTQDLFKRMSENGSLKEEIHTINYLFKNCTPEFPGVSLREWLAGSKTLIESIQKSVNIIRNHPLMPRDVRIRGFLIDEECGKLSEIEVHDSKIA